MDPFTVAQEGDVSPSPSPLVKSKRWANRYLFAVVKLLLFAFPLHLLSWNGRFQRRAGSINGPLYSCTRRRRCLVALPTRKKQKISKQVFVCRCETAPIRIPPHLLSWNGRFQRRAGSVNGPLDSCTRGRRCLVALSALKSKDWQTGICLPRVNHSHSHPHCICFVAMSASSNALETSIPEFSAVKDGDVASLPSPLVKSKRSANRYLFAVVKLLLFASPLHLFTWNGGLQRRAGSINEPLYSCTRRRRCLVALPALKK